MWGFAERRQRPRPRGGHRTSARVIISAGSTVCGCSGLLGLEGAAGTRVGPQGATASELWGHRPPVSHRGLCRSAFPLRGEPCGGQARACAWCPLFRDSAASPDRCRGTPAERPDRSRSQPRCPRRRPGLCHSLGRSSPPSGWIGQTSSFPRRRGGGGACTSQALLVTSNKPSPGCES